VNVVHLTGLARKPEGDLILCDVARRDASIIVEELRQLGIARDGSISMEPVETQLSAAADAAGRAPEELTFGDAVVWEEVEARTSEETSLSINFVEFMMIAALIAAVGILLDSPILIVGAMVVGPEFGPVAGFCVAVVQRRGDLARRSATALAVGIAAAVAATVAWSLVFKWTGIDSEGPRRGAPAHRVHFQPGLLFVLRRLPGGHCGRAVADVRPSRVRSSGC
jgi:hypothetical protein